MAIISLLLLCHGPDQPLVIEGTKNQNAQRNFLALFDDDGKGKKGERDFVFFFSLPSYHFGLVQPPERSHIHIISSIILGWVRYIYIYIYIWIEWMI
jgi:hypothetical protein